MDDLCDGAVTECVEVCGVEEQGLRILSERRNVVGVDAGDPPLLADILCDLDQPSIMLRDLLPEVAVLDFGLRQGLVFEF